MYQVHGVCMYEICYTAPASTAKKVPIAISNKRGGGLLFMCLGRPGARQLILAGWWDAGESRKPKVIEYIPT